MQTYIHTYWVLNQLQYSPVYKLWLFQLGANAILAVSLAVCKAGATVKKIPLYKV